MLQVKFKLRTVLFIVILTNFYFLTYELQLWSNFLSPWTKLISGFIVLIFLFVTFPYIKYFNIIIKNIYKSKLLILYLFFLLYVIILGPSVDNTKNYFCYYIIFLLYHYIAIVSILIFFITGINRSLKMLNKLMIYYIMILSIPTIVIYVAIGSGMLDIINYKISYTEYFNVSVPHLFNQYFFPYGISLFRGDEVKTFLDFDFYRAFSLSSESGKAALYASVALIFSYRYKHIFLFILIYYLMLASMLSYLAIIYIVIAYVFRKYTKIFIILNIIGILSLTYIIINLFIKEKNFDFSILGILGTHVYNSFHVTYVFLDNFKPSMFGSGYTSLPFILPLQVITKFGYVGGSVFLIFYISLFFYALKNISSHNKNIRLYSIFIIFILIQIVKQAFIFYYFYIFYILMYLFYVINTNYKQGFIYESSANQ